MTTGEIFSASSDMRLFDVSSHAQSPFGTNFRTRVRRIAGRNTSLAERPTRSVGITMVLAICAVLLLMPQHSHAQNSNVGIGTTSPDPSAILDLTATGKGLLIPRMTTSQYNPGISSPAQGLLVYDLTAHTFYYYNGTIWLPFLGWSLTGNTSINPTVNFLGTTDAEPLIMKTNGIEDLRLTPSGLIGVGITTPVAKFEVSGNVRIDTSSGGASQLQFETPSGSFVTSFQSGAQSSSISYILPTLQGVANSVLGNNGSGTLSWVLTSSYDWSLTGNASTNPNINFLGTSDNTDFVFRTNNIENMRLTASGLFGIGTSTPTQKLEVHGNIKLDSVGGSSSLLIFSNPAGTFNTTFQAGAQTTNLNYTLPITQGGANTVLTNNGSGTLSWTLPGSANLDWALLGNAGTVDGVNFLGTTDNVALTLRVDSVQALRIESNGRTNPPNLIGGWYGNTTAGTLGSVIAGGGSGGAANTINTNYDFIGGGVNNTAGDGGGSSSEAEYIAIAGGSGNTATGHASSILGGQFQTASGRFSSILGGEGDITYGFSQSVVGQFNDPFPTTPCSCTNNPFTYPAFIVGGGTGTSSRYNSMVVDFRGVLELGEEGSNSTYSATPELKISGSSSGYVGFEAAATTNSHHYVMPASQGSANTVLTNDGSGNLSWGVGPTGVPQRYAITTLASFSTSQNNLHLDTTKTIFRVTCTPAINITGLADTSDGRFVILTNYSGKTITITNQDVSSTAVYRIITGTGSSATLLVDKSISFFYDGETQRWRLLNQTP
jgi:hypothetical protein